MFGGGDLIVTMPDDLSQAAVQPLFDWESLENEAINYSLCCSELGFFCFGGSSSQSSAAGLGTNRWHGCFGAKLQPLATAKRGRPGP